MTSFTANGGAPNQFSGRALRIQRGLVKCSAFAGAPAPPNYTTRMPFVRDPSHSS